MRSGTWSWPRTVRLWSRTRRAVCGSTLGNHLVDLLINPLGDLLFLLGGLISRQLTRAYLLVNALVGKNITAVTSHGAGTEIVIAYAHKSQEAALRDLLEREVPGQYRLIVHEQPNLRRQVLLDLPDIDSKYA